MENREMEDLLQQCVVDYRRYHLLDSSDNEQPDSDEVEKIRMKAKLAWDTLIAVFEGHDECTETLFQDADISTDEITRRVFRWKDGIILPAGFNTRTAVRTADNVPDCVAQIEEILEAWLWPFVKVVRYVVVSIPADKS